MNKGVLFFSILLLLLIVFPKQGTGELVQDDVTVIPDDSIRLRILANSNTEQDQQIKYDIRDQVNEEITKWVAQMSNIDDARDLIKERISYVQTIAEDVVAEAGLSYDVHVVYDKRVTFPRKLYGSYMYPEGEYEAILMTIGAGEGDNWWCVLFPPLCFLDFSFGATVQETDDVTDEEDDLTIKFFLFEWLGWS